MTLLRATFGRRAYAKGALGADAGAGAGTLLADGARASAQGAPGSIPEEDMPRSMRRPKRLNRVEAEVRDCEIEGTVPADLNGAFYRVGPDPQYPLAPRNIPFDGEGHVSMFRIKNGRVDYLSRYVKNERYLAQDRAGRGLFPLYRNPMMDDPSVEGLSRSTANTHIIDHRGMLLALKEDSPPAAMNLLTLETLEPNYTFHGQLPSQTFTAHPKTDSVNGNMVAFGYEATGFGSKDVSVFEITPQGDIVWNASVEVPYVGMLHDFGVTERHIVFYVIPLAFDQPQMESGGIHWSWDASKPTYFGFLRRGGDGKDIRWIEGPTRSATHVLGVFDDGNKLFIDVEMSMSNPFPFMPMRDGTPWDPVAGRSHITRLTVDLSKRQVSGYDIETLYPQHIGALPRQDDRYNTVPYRYGFLPCPDPDAADPRHAAACYARFDVSKRSAMLFNAGPDTALAECCFAPRSRDAREAEGYLLGVATRLDENNRADLVILDAEHIDEGPVATVKLPIPIVGQIHGWWVPEDRLPAGPA